MIRWECNTCLEQAENLFGIVVKLNDSLHVICRNPSPIGKAGLEAYGGGPDAIYRLMLSQMLSSEVMTPI